MALRTVVSVITLVSTIVASVALPALAQQPSPRSASGGIASGSSVDPAPTARTVRVDAVVTDRQGRPVLNLKPQDFEVIENGVSQKIDAVEMFATSAGSIAATPDDDAAAAPITSDEDERRAAREPGTRLFALVLDEFHVDAGTSSDRVREAARRFLKDQIRPNDLLVVLKPLDPLTDIRFTRDRSSALQAIDSFAGRNGDYTPRTEFEEKYIGRAPSAVRTARVQIVLSALRALTMKLGELDAGRAAIVLVSEGFIREVGRDRRAPDIQGLVRAASRYHVAIYALDPTTASPLATPGAAAPDPAETLRALAVQTGGEAVFDPAGLDGAFQRVARDLDAYYIISYTSSDPADGRFYDLLVRTRRRDTQVRTRSGYWAPLREELMRATREATSRPLRALRYSPLIQTWMGITVQPDGTQQVIFTWEPSNPRPGLRRPPVPSVVQVRVRAPSGALLYEGDLRSPRAEFGVSEYGDAAVFHAAPGRIQIDLAVLAADGGQIDTAAHDVDVPDAAGASLLILPPQVLRAHSARDFRQLSSDSAAAPVPTREFRRTDRLLLRVPVHSAAGAPIALAARLLNRLGQALRELPATGRANAAGIYEFDLPLGWLAPGDYSVEFTAKTDTQSTKETVRFKLIS